MPEPTPVFADTARLLATPTPPPSRAPWVIATWVQSVILSFVLGMACPTQGCLPGPRPIPPAPGPAPTPTPTPIPVPPWIPPGPKPPNPMPAANEWRALEFAPGWEGYGRDVDGEFLIATWRRLSAGAPRT